MMMKISSKIAAMAAVLGVAAGVASAPAMATACVVTDLTGADACYGLVSGNIETPESNPFFYGDLIPSSAFGGAFGLYTTWTLAAYDSSDVAGDSNFLAGGHWTLDLSELETELVIVLKQGNDWGAWYFNPAEESGSWTTSWQGNGKGYSHGFALTRTSGTPEQHDFPEPATLSLLGLGLIGAGIARRRRAV
jgi:hypothetical protein